MPARAGRASPRPASAAGHRSPADDAYTHQPGFVRRGEHFPISQRSDKHRPFAHGSTVRHAACLTARQSTSVRAGHGPGPIQEIAQRDIAVDWCDTPDAPVSPTGQRPALRGAGILARRRRAGAPACRHQAPPPVYGGIDRRSRYVSGAQALTHAAACRHNRGMPARRSPRRGVGSLPAGTAAAVQRQDGWRLCHGAGITASPYAGAVCRHCRAGRRCGTNGCRGGQCRRRQRTRGSWAARYATSCPRRPMDPTTASLSYACQIRDHSARVAKQPGQVRRR
jgi:hypothetical protein